MRSAKVSELKARLSSYLSAVRKGESVIVCDRLTPIARLVPLERGLEELEVLEPVRAAVDLKRIKPVRLLRRVDAIKMLRESRDQR